MKKSNSGKKYSTATMEKIRTRAQEIWSRKCEALNTALDDWLQAERELRIQNQLKHKRAEDYTEEDVRKIKERAQVVREEKVGQLHTAFDDWIEAEKELKEELKGKVNIKDLFDLWFTKVAPSVDQALTDGTPLSDIDIIMSEHYIELMAEVMK
jgi:hypothetical protein